MSSAGPAGKSARWRASTFLRSARIILLPAKGAGTEDVLAKEKLCPVVAILPYKTFQEAVAKAKANLLVEGAGHSAAVHSNNEANIRDGRS